MADLQSSAEDPLYQQVLMVSSNASPIQQQIMGKLRLQKC